MKLALLFLLSASSVLAASDDLSKAIQRGLAARDKIQAINEESAPAEFRVTEKREEDESKVVVSYFRGSRRVFQVLWKKDWQGERAKMYTATLFDGEDAICRIIRLSGDKATVTPVKRVASSIEVWVGVSDTGGGSVDVMKDGSFFESVVIAGRDSRPISASEYAKNVIGVEDVAKPIGEAIKKEAKKANKAPEPTP